MATKSKKSNPALAFTVYFISLTLLITGIIMAIWSVLETGVALDYKRSSDYTGYAMSQLLRAGYYGDLEVLNNEGGNIAYLVTNSFGEISSNGTQASNSNEFIAEIDAQLALSKENFNDMAVKSSNQGYDSLIVVRDGMLYEKSNIRGGGTREENLPVSMSRYSNNLEVGNATICIAVKAEGAFTNNYGMIYNAYYNWYQQMILRLVTIGVIVISLLALLAVQLKKESLRFAYRKLAIFTGGFWIEVKVIALVIFLPTCIVYGYDYAYFFIFGFWFLWLFLNDLHINKKKALLCNIPNSLKKLFVSLDSKYLFCARMKRRLLLLILAEFCLVLLCALFILAMQEFGVFLSFFPMGLGLFILVCYIRTYNKEIDSFTEIMDYAAKIRAGDSTQPLTLPTGSVFIPLVDNLNEIHSGMAHMVEERVHSEQMKVELITNVSHDLKTPLTSIINYVDLLSKEILTPDFTNDYVKILQDKSERLKNLVQDLFEISKANSGTIDLNLEQLCIQSLVEQTVAELDTRTEQAGVEIKLQLCDIPLNIRADGKKLHRVFENLLGNALKYSLAGTRIYISVIQADTNAQVIIKNIAGYEMTFTAEDIIERFRRGDISRTSEGSGLGLAIAKSFLELNGGSLNIELDGDLFKAIVQIPLYVPYAQREVQELSEEMIEISEE